VASHEDQVSFPAYPVQHITQWWCFLSSTITPFVESHSGSPLVIFVHNPVDIGEYLVRVGYCILTGC